MLLKAIERLRLSYRQKKDPYPLVTISGDPISYGDRMIYFKIRLMELEIKGKHMIVSFDVLLLGKDKTVLGMPFLQEYNPRINWITGDIEIRDT